MPSLYDITNTHVELTAWIESGDLTPEQEQQANDYLDRLLTGLLPEKVDGYCRLIKSLEADSKAHAEEAKRISNRKRAIENKVASLKERLKGALIQTGTMKLKAGTFTVAIQANPPSVVVDDIEALPDSLKVISVDANKTAIKDLLKAGEVVPGCRLEQREGLRIR